MGFGPGDRTGIDAANFRLAGHLGHVIEKMQAVGEKLREAVTAVSSAFSRDGRRFAARGGNAEDGAVVIWGEQNRVAALRAAAA